MPSSISAVFPLTVIPALLLLLSACGEHATRKAGEGATIGAASGAVGGLVGALVFGGDPVEAAARGAVYGGSAGATAGAISGSEVDARIAAERKAEEDRIRAEIGEDAFHGLTDLMNCDHAGALADAELAMQSKNPNFTVSGHWLELLTYADQGNLGEIEELIPEVVSIDWETDDEEQARRHLDQLKEELLVSREDYGLPVQCG